MPLLFAVFAADASAQTVLTNIQILDTQNIIGNNVDLAALTVGSNAVVTFESDSELVIAAGGTLRAAPGSVVDLFHATIALPDALTLNDAQFGGANARLLDGATLTLLSGSTLVAQAGSSIDLSAGDVAFPTTVVLTTGAQALFGKTLVSPIISNITSASSEDFAVAAGGSGAALVLGQGINGVATLNRKLDITNLLSDSGDASYVLWGGNNRYGLTANKSIFNSVDNFGGAWQYNPELVPGDVNFGLGFEHKYQAAPTSADTEFYYWWTSASGDAARRIFQANTSWGSDGNDPLPKGHTRWIFDVNRFVINNRSSIGLGDFLVDFDESTPLFSWRYDTNFFGTTTLFGLLQHNGTITGPNGNTTIRAGTGASRTIEFITTNAGGVANPALTLEASQNAKFAAGASFRNNVNVTNDGLLHLAPRLLNLGGNSPRIAMGRTGDTTSWEFASGDLPNSFSIAEQSIARRFTIEPGGITKIVGANSSLSVAGTTEASTAGIASMKTAGGIYAAKSIMAGLDVVASGNIVVLGGSFLGGGAGLTLNSSLLAQPISFNLASTEVARFSGSKGNLLIGGNTDIPGSSGLKIFGSTASTSPTSGALQVVGGAGVGGALNVGGNGAFAGDVLVGGAVTFADGSVLASALGGITLAASGTDQNIALVPSGAGTVATPAGIIAAGNLVTTATTPATSPSTGALVVSGGAAIQQQLYLGDDLVIVPTSDPNATVRMSGTAVANAPGIWLHDSGTPTDMNVALSGTTTATILNGPLDGAVDIRVGNTNYLSVNSSALTLQDVPLTVNATTVSTSTTTGSATFAGGIGVAGRTSTNSLSVGNGAAMDLIHTSITALNFPPIAPNGGVEDLNVTLSGADIADAVNIVEADGAFAPAGIIVRAIVTSSNTVTVRATNFTSAAIDPDPANYRITLLSF